MGFVQARLGRFLGDEIVLGVEISPEAATQFEEVFGCRVASEVGAEALAGLWAGLDLVWVTVVDDRLGEVSHALKDRLCSEAVVLHTSGAVSSRVFGDLGYACGSLHPLTACPETTCDDAACYAHYCGLLHTAEGDVKAVSLAEALVSRLGGHVVIMDPAQKARYHAAAVLGSNYSLILCEVTEKLFCSCGFSEADSRGVVRRLLAGSLVALETHSPSEALTGGPVRRRDAGTIALHRASLAEDGDVLSLYDAFLGLAKRMVGWTDDLGILPKGEE
ncbi:MAG: DUF2520 domain-containing protein [Proteobacteria bacterium]|nr:DUF2520 domain-containing protein [Pseudomonadota bacterium]